MTLNDLWQDILALIPIAGFAAAVIASVVYVRYKGTTDALKETVSTYEGLAEAYKKESDALKDQISELETKIDELEAEIKGQALAFEQLTKRFIESVKFGACIYSESCKDFKPPSR